MTVKIIGKPFRHSAVDTHAIELCCAFILARENDGLAIGGNAGILLKALVGCQAGGSAVRQVVFPEIAFGGEDDGIFVDGGGAIIAFLLSGDYQTESETQECQEWPWKHG